MNYDLVMQDELKALKEAFQKPRLLLHSCCAPCSTTVISELKDCFDLTIFYYNPNIEPKEEYEKRKAEQIKLIEKLNIKLLDCDYENVEFRVVADGLENEKEGGKRCYNCYKLRIETTAKSAKDGRYDYFATTLSVSPHKNSQFINEIGQELQEKYNVKFLFADFKKRDGYRKSIELSTKYNLYRQDYCGCLFSKKI